VTGIQTWGHVNCSCLPPLHKCSVISFRMSVNAPFNAAFGLHNLQSSAMGLVCCRWLLAERALHWHQLTLSSVYSVLLCSHRVHHLAFDYRRSCTMTRLRGRPRRGSPWKPRRPSNSRSVSSSLSSSSCSHSSRSHSGHLSSTSRRLEYAHSPSWALVPYADTPPPRQPDDLPTPPLHPEPDPHQTSRGAGPLPRDASTPAQIWDSMAVLYDLVFGIRQGVDDLNFRLQETDAKVDLFLSTLASLQDSMTTRQKVDSPVQEQSAPQEDPAMGATKGPDRGATSGSKAVNTVDDGEGDKSWADQITFIEEEPWTDDIQPMRPAYSPYV
jgi:hypothetical protein